MDRADEGGAVDRERARDLVADEDAGDVDGPAQLAREDVPFLGEDARDAAADGAGAE